MPLPNDSASSSIGALTIRIEVQTPADMYAPHAKRTVCYLDAAPPQRTSRCAQCCRPTNQEHAALGLRLLITPAAIVGAVAVRVVHVIRVLVVLLLLEAPRSRTEGLSRAVAAAAERPPA